MANPSDNTAEISSSGDQSALAPQDLGEVADSIQNTLLGIWSDFVNHIPYFVGGLIILLLTWAITAAISRTSRRLMRRSRLRQSLKDLIARLIVIAVSIFGSYPEIGCCSMQSGKSKIAACENP